MASDNRSVGRRARGGSFGGSLLSAPTPLPDEDEFEGPTPTSPVESTEVTPPPPPLTGHGSSAEEASARVTRDANETSREQPASRAPKSTPPREAAPAPARAGTSGRGRQGPPQTLRVDDSAGAELWDAFLEEKNVDPFLSYRQFASRVVTEGLRAEARRKQRRSG